jgi:hypothetical protein
MKLFVPSIFAATSAAAVATLVLATMLPLSSAVTLTCQIETQFDFDAPDGTPPAVPSKVQFQQMGIDLMTSFQDAYVRNEGINMLSDRFSRFKMKRIKNPATFIDGDDEDNEENRALFEAGLVGPDDVVDLIVDGRAGNLRRGSGGTSADIDDDEDSSSDDGGSGSDGIDEFQPGAPSLTKSGANRRRRFTRPPTRAPKPVYQNWRYNANTNFVGSVQCNWCDDDRRFVYLTDSSSSSTDTVEKNDDGTATMGLGTVSEHQEWETAFCNHLKTLFPHATHCYISVSGCNYGYSDGENDPDLESGADGSNSTSDDSELTNYLVTDLLDHISAIDVDAELDSSIVDDNDEETVVYSILALDPDQVSAFFLSSALENTHQDA